MKLVGSGRKVRLILDYGDEEPEAYPEARPEGWLVALDEYGEAQLGVGDDPEDVVIHYCWPLLAVEPLDEED